MQTMDKTIAGILVEDDDFVRAQIEAWLRGAPAYRCVGSFPDGETALDEVRATNPALAIVDFGLPGIKGAEVIWQLKRGDPRIKIILITGIPDNAILFEALEVGVDGFLDKPLKREAFLAQLEEVLAGGCPLSARAAKLLVEDYRKYRPNAYEVRPLTAREREIAELVCRGLNDEAIAKKLGIAIWTVRTHQKNIHHKLDIHCRTELQIKLLDLHRKPPGQPGP